MRTFMARTRFGSAEHLMKRFFRSLGGAAPSSEQESWALTQLLPGEQRLWKRMSAADRRHALEVAKDSSRLLEAEGYEPGREVLAAALLHDVGKVESGLGTFARVATTLAAMIFGRDRLLGSSGAARASSNGNALAAAGSNGAGVWAAPGGRPSLLSGARLYLIHDRVGGELLRAAGSDPFTIAWAEQHHLAPARWTVDRRIGELLRFGDGS